MSELSGGQKARVCFASITCRAPEILILDEPTNHLDIESVEALIEALALYKGAHACVIYFMCGVTHLRATKSTCGVTYSYVASCAHVHDDVFFGH